MDIAVAITRFGLAMNECGAVAADDERGFASTGSKASAARAELVAAIKRSLVADKPVVLPYAGTVVIGEPGLAIPTTLRLPPFDGVEAAQMALER